MESGEGMVAVVRGLRDSGLAVTLLDGTRHYTLMPNTGRISSSNARLKHDVASQHSDVNDGDQPARYDSGAQATDGRYASMYKMAHCRMNPTSPPVQLTEFPPQRVDINRGQGNFEIGGCGSGESYTPCKSNGSFRGAMSWPDRGSVCSPRPSREPDAFANSLRKYPTLSAERSTEIVERLINYTQAKHLAKTYQNRNSPSREGIEYTTNRVTTDRCNSRNVLRSPSNSRSFDQDTSYCSQVRRLEESPTRDIRPRSGTNEYEYADCRRLRSPESRYAKDVSKRVKDQIRTVNSYSSSNSVNMEVQAAVEMVSREVTTVPRSQPIRRTVADPLTPTTSCHDQKPKGEVSIQVTQKPISKPIMNFKYVQTAAKVEDLSVQANSSSIDITDRRQNCQCFPLNRRSKSEEKVTVYKDLEEDLLDLLEKVSVCPSADPKANDLRRKVLKRMSIKLQRLSHNLDRPDDGEKAKIQIGKMLKYVPIWVPYGDVQAYRNAITDEIIDKIRKFKSISQFKTVTQVYRTEVPQFQIGSQTDELNIIIKDFIKSLPIKAYDNECLAVKNNVSDKYVNKIQRMILRKSKDVPSENLRMELLNFIYTIPMNVHSSHKYYYLNQVICSFINKIVKVMGNSHVLQKDYINYDVEANNADNKNFITKNEIKEIISNPLQHLFRHAHSFCDTTYLSYVETELIDVISESLREINLGNDMDVVEEIVLLLRENDIISENQAKAFAKQLLTQLKDILKTKNANQSKCLLNNKQTQSYVVLQNTSGNLAPRKVSNIDNYNQQSPLNTSLNKSDSDSNMNNYLNQLRQQIDEWLQNSKMTIPYAHDKGFREIVIHDLASDIIDRQKYLDLNPSSRGTNEDELEHLKYQIFKWINKLAGEENMETLDHAPGLMERIQSIPVPVLSQQQNSSDAVGCLMPGCPQTVINTMNYSSSSRNENELPNQSMTSNIKLSDQMQNQMKSNTDLNKSNLRKSLPKISPTAQDTSSCCAGVSTQHSTPSTKQLNKEYDEYLKNWVNEIPIPSSTPNELALAEKARQGIYNGVWKALTKLKFDPAVFHNTFYYEDALDEELEELLKCLPETEEMKAKKHLLKVKLIEKTTNTNEMIRNSAAPASFRQQLLESVAQDLQTKNKTLSVDDSSKPTSEDIQLQKMVDDYILCTKFKEIDKPKTEVYRKKLIKEAQAIAEKVKKSHGKELQDIDTDLYVNNILNALHKVPLPKADILEEEANEIEMSQEVDLWLKDLQVIRNDDVNNQQETSKLKNALVKRILELERDVNILDCSGEKALKHEISSFLEKIPVQDQSNNLDFIAQEFTNRLKNKAKECQEGQGERKSVAFLDSVGYYEFSLQMPGCSSFSEMPLRPALADQSSYMIKDGSIAKMPPPRYLQYEPYQVPSNEYFTIEDSQAPKKPKPITKPMVVDGNLPVEEPPASHGLQNQPQPNPCCQLAGNRQSNGSYQVEPQNFQPQMQSNPCCQYAKNGQFVENYQRQEIEPNLPQNQSALQSLIPNTNMTSNPLHNQRSPCCGVNKTSVPVTPGPPTTINPRATQTNMINTSTGIQPCCQGNQEINRIASTTQRRNSSVTPVQTDPRLNMSQRLPIVVEVPIRSGSFHQPSNQQYEAEISNYTANRNLPGSMTTYGQPQGFSTPQHQGITQEFPPRPNRKKSRRQDRQGNFAKRRLDLDDESDNEKDVPCPCIRRMWHEPICYAYEDFGTDRLQCYPFPYSCPHFY